ncbi:MAG: ATP-binding protein [Chloroflexi bacterium]|nr:ATP-binding protein [Chloroflexota bacterium]
MTKAACRCASGGSYLFAGRGLVNQAQNVLCFGLPGTGKTHLAAAVGLCWWKTALVRAVYADLQGGGAAAAGWVQEYELERELDRRLDRFGGGHSG